MPGPYKQVRLFATCFMFHATCFRLTYRLFHATIGLLTYFFLPMNLTELARRLQTNPDDLRQKLPDLGFAIGKRAIKVDDRVAHQIMAAWSGMRRQERLQQKWEEQKQITERQQRRGQEDVSAKEIALPAFMTVREFSTMLQLPVPRVMKELMHNGIMASQNERIDFDTAAVISEDLGFRAVKQDASAPDQKEEQEVDRLAEVLGEEAKQDLEARAPVIVVMGHVDHGKTKLLDAIRRTHVMEGEAGGITQHIGAYQVERNDRKLTFIDTPGHEAFTVMRSRGAKVADIAILVVAADDGVQPQTKEAIDIIKSSNLPFIVALNKIDRPGANIDRVKGQLAELKIVAEDWGGDIIVVPVSAKEGTGIDDVLDRLILVADMHGDTIQANHERRAMGTIIESHVDAGEGVVATVLVQTGTLKIGDTLGVRNLLYGRVRGMRNWNGEALTKAGPSTPVKIIGFKEAPAVGDILEVPEHAEDLEKLKTTAVRATEEVASIQSISSGAETEEEAKAVHKLSLIIRADVLGSLEAILGMLDKIRHPAVRVEVVQKGLGNITDGDVLNAQAVGAVIYGFNVRPTTTAAELARDKEVTIDEFSVIYRLFEDVLNRLEKLLPSEMLLHALGRLEVLANFRKIDHGWVIGGRAIEGKILNKAKIRLIRADQMIGEGEILSLQSGRSDAKEIKSGQECGLSYRGKVKAEPGDILEVYREELKGQLLEIEGIKRR